MKSCLNLILSFEPVKSHKELKEEYRRKKFRMGVFKIVNNTNGKIFVGSTTDLDAAWNSHRFRLKAGLHGNTALQNDWNQSGVENFAYEIVEVLELKNEAETDPGSELKALEELLMDELQPFGERGYNKQKKQ